jgi:hypothetical protein
MTFDEEATSSRVASSRVRIAALAVALAASLSAAGPSLASGSAAPTTHPGNSGNSANARPAGNSSRATSKGKPPTTPGHGAPTSGSANAIAQSIGAASIVLTELDGSTVSITVTQGTRVFVNGSRASLDGVKPGFVVSATWVAGNARLLEAFNLGPGGVDVGIVASVSAKAIVVTRSDGSKVTIRVGRRTRVLLDGDPATRSAVKAGDTVVYSPRLKRNSPAAVLRFLRPG